MHGNQRIRRTAVARFVGCLVMVLLLLAFWACCFVAEAVAKAPKPQVSAFEASPSEVESAGSVSVSATVSGATSCTLSANKAVAGLPVTFPCEGTPDDVIREVTMPSNATKKAVRYKLTLLATGAGGKTKAKLTVRVSPAGPGPALSVAAGRNHTCAVVSSGHVFCWGDGSKGQLGDRSANPSSFPVEVLNITNAVQVAARGNHTCTVLATGHVQCWGENNEGELGDGSSLMKKTPIEVKGISDATQVAAGESSTCALLSTGHIDCWGSNARGALGNGETGPEPCTEAERSCSLTPVEVTGIATATSVEAAGEHVCALLSDGSEKCWGANEHGELGTGSNVGPETCFYHWRGAGPGAPCSRTPVSVQGIMAVRAIGTGGNDSCAALESEAVECWGDDHSGELGDGNSGADSDIPAEVLGVTTAVALSLGKNFGCAALASGHVECWGGNAFGQLGSGTETGPETCSEEACSTRPVEAAGITSAAAIGAGNLHACAVLTDGHVDCWGDDEQGELGNGSASHSSDTPVEVQGVP
jgi:alpha-tubulin suppressor-like RCC1 family protein